MSLTALVTLRLLQPSAEAIAPSFTTLAVLPFGTQSSQDSLASSAVGLSQDLLLRLQSLGSIQCVSRGQILATAYPGTPRRLIARQVGAEVMILGEVRRLAHGLGLRLNIEDARTGRVLAELDLTASTERIFDLQRRATREVLAVLGMPVSTSERSRLDEDPTRRGRDRFGAVGDRRDEKARKGGEDAVAEPALLGSATDGWCGHGRSLRPRRVSPGTGPILTR